MNHTAIIRRLSWFGRAVSVSLLGVVFAACGEMPTELPMVDDAPSALATASAVTGETITTDLDDYVPGDTVHVTGSGWLPGDSVDLVLTEDTTIHGPLNFSVGVDGSGAFSISPYVVEEHDIGVTFTLTATSRATGATATATFSDCDTAVCFLVQLTGAAAAVMQISGYIGTDCVTDRTFTIPVQFTSALPRFLGFGGVGSVKVVAPANVGPDDKSFLQWSPRAFATASDQTLCVTSGAHQKFATHEADYGVSNSPPTVLAHSVSVTVNEGDLAVNTGTVSDPDGHAVTLSASVGTVVNNGDGTWSWSFPTTDGPTESQVVTITADDGNGATAQTTFQLTVDNVAPTVGAVTVPLDPIGINNQPVTGVSAPYTDPGTGDTHTCTVDYDVGTGPQSGTATAGTCTGPSHTYSAAGVYTVTVTVTDDDGDSGQSTAETMIVIYDASGGFVTGGGWIDSPAGAYKADTDLMGKATFGFVSKYKRGATVPTGNTEFQFRAGGFDFHSSSYEWLVITMAGTNAQYKGEGTVNGSLAPGEVVYKFMLWARDQGEPGTGIDTFRIKIWYEGGMGEVVVYDNGFDQTIAKGNIQVRTN